MDTWQPISITELDILLTAEVADCSLEQRALFERYKVAPHLVQIAHLDGVEAIFVVARSGDLVLYYEDVEEGFNISTLSPDGSVVTPGCEQWNLGHALEQLAAA